MDCNYKNILDEASDILKNYNIKNPRLDSELLLSNSLNISRENLLLNLNNKIDSTKYKIFKSLLERRKKKMPIAYILGYKNFWKSRMMEKIIIAKPINRENFSKFGDMITTKNLNALDMIIIIYPNSRTKSL